MDYISQETAAASRCDFKTNLSTIGAFEIVQDAVCCYFSQIGIDQIVMRRKHNFVWVFSKNKLKFIKHIKWNEKFSVRCFISSRSSVRIVVDTILENEKGETCIYSKLEVCLLDIAKQKLAVITDEILPKNIEPKQSQTKIEFAKFAQMKEFKEAKKTLKFQVQSTNIDYCEHTNNVEYIRFILNSFSMENLKRMEIKSVEINYNGQTRIGDKLTLFANSQQGRSLFAIKHKREIKTKCEIIYKQN